VSSLRVRLLLWVLGPMTVVLGLSAALSWRDARSVARLVQDRQLLASAQVMAGQVEWRDGTLVAQTPPAALEIFASEARDRVYFQVRTEAGALLAGWPDLPAADVEGATPRYGTVRFRDDAVRRVSLTRTLFQDGKPMRVQVSVAETRRAFDDLVRTLWWPDLRHQSVLLMLALALMLLGLTLELRPLLRLRADLLARDSADLAPLRTTELQRELRPIVETLNQYAARLTRQVEQQRRFIADAAHQLRTPVALIGTQLHYASGQAASPELRDTLQALRDGSRHLTQLINQLLSLSQAEARRGTDRALQPVALLALSRDVLIELALLADQRGVDLGLDPASVEVMATADPALAHALLFNLVDNAIRYTPRGGSVTVQVDRTDAQAGLRVEDTGPGIPAELRPHVFERFYRGNATDVEGSGLGLAIVREAAAACRARVELGSGAGGTGLRVQVRFGASPCAQAAFSRSSSRRP
jgi:two-component system, OmpR family, sensor histidine kinase TctE